MVERTELKMVTCSDCSHFQPDTIGFGQGLGKCAVVENETTPMGRQKLYIECGGKSCWNGSDTPNRFCQHFNAIGG